MEQNTMQAEASTVQESAAIYAVTTEQPSLEFVMALASRLALTEQLQVIQFLAQQLSAKTQALATPQNQPQKNRSLRPSIWPLPSSAGTVTFNSRKSRRSGSRSYPPIPPASSRTNGHPHSRRRCRASGGKFLRAQSPVFRAGQPNGGCRRGH